MTIKELALLDYQSQTTLNSSKKSFAIIKESIALENIMSDQLEILTTWESTRLYIDSGTGAHQDLGVFSPVIPSGYYMVGHFAQRDHSTMMKGIVPLVKPLVDGAIKPPLAFEQVWNDKGSGGHQNVSFWRPVPPPGYVAVGDVINLGYNPPEDLKKTYACIKADLVVQGMIGPEIWSDKGSGADQEISIWTIQPITEGVTGTFLAEGCFCHPSDEYAQCLRTNSFIK